MDKREFENTDLYKLLNRSLHGEISDREKIVMEDALVNNQKLREEKTTLVRLQKLIANQKYRFNPYFSARVMHQIELSQEPTGLFSSLNYAFMRISFPTMLAIFIWVLVFWGTEGTLSVDGLLGVAGLSYDELVTDYFVSN